MTYAVDTNIILDIFFDDPAYAQCDIDFLNSLSTFDDLIACDVVWAEASAAFADKAAFRRQMAAFGIAYSPMPEAAAVRAGEIWKIARRAKPAGRTAIIPDFLIGAHAVECADALITRDRGFTRKWFADLRICDPSVSGSGN